VQEFRNSATKAEMKTYLNGMEAFINQEFATVNSINPEIKYGLSFKTHKFNNNLLTPVR
jgi:hypothetical protein